MEALRIDPPTQERRLAPRVPVRYRAEFVALGEKQARHGHTVDISSCGVRVRSPDPVPTGTRPRLLVRRSGMSQSMPLPGTVTRCDSPRGVSGHELGPRLQPLD